MVKKPKYIAFDLEFTGLNPWYGDRITCICAKDSDGNRFEMVDEDEQHLIDSFLDWLGERSPERYILVSKNGKQSDVPFILTRLAIEVNGTPKRGYGILDYEHFDLHELTENWVTLGDMAKLLKCTPKLGSGKNAIKLWKEKRYHELQKYCFQDVETTEEVYLKYINLQ